MRSAKAVSDLRLTGQIKKEVATGAASVQGFGEQDDAARVPAEAGRAIGVDDMVGVAGIFTDFRLRRWACPVATIPVGPARKAAWRSLPAHYM